MKTKLTGGEKFIIICIITITLMVVRGKEMFLLLGGVPGLFNLMAILVAAEYLDAEDIHFEYMDKEELIIEDASAAEWSQVIHASHYDRYYAFVVDSQEEYIEKYEQYGMRSKAVEGFDFEKNILIISLNRGLTDIRLIKSAQRWENGELISFPQFVYDGKEENDMAYFYMVPRLVAECKEESHGVSEHVLKLASIPYMERNEEHNGNKLEPQIEAEGLFKRWKWAFNIANEG